MKINKQGYKKIDNRFSVIHTYLHTTYLAILVDGSQKSNETFDEIRSCPTNMVNVFVLFLINFYFQLL